MIGSALRSLRRLTGRRDRAAAGALVLLYHRLGDNRRDPWSLGVAPERFGAHMRLLARTMRPMSLVELADRAAAGRLPRNAVAVTFDDGYAAHLDRLVEAATRAGVPVTSFLCSGALDGRREMWWDELECVLLAGEERPRMLTLELGDWTYREDLGTDARAGWDAEPRRVAWRAWEPPPGARERAYVALYERLFALAAADRRRALDALLEWSGSAPAPRDSHRIVTVAEVRSLAAVREITIGAHTVTHARLSDLAPREQAREIGESKDALSEIVGEEVSAFAYPFGRRSDYDDRTLELVRAHGFSIACANVPGAVTAESSVLELPRVQVQDWSADELAARMARWSAAA